MHYLEPSILLVKLIITNEYIHVCDLYNSSLYWSPLAIIMLWKLNIVRAFTSSYIRVYWKLLVWYLEQLLTRFGIRVNGVLHLHFYSDIFIYTIISVCVNLMVFYATVIQLRGLAKYKIRFNPPISTKSLHR